MTHRRFTLLLFVSLILFAEPTFATTPEPPFIRLWDTVAPDTQSTVVPNVLEYIPAKSASPTAAIIIAPGGGYQSLQMQEEGENAADWFKAHGIAAFVPDARGCWPWRRGVSRQRSIAKRHDGRHGPVIVPNLVSNLLG